MVRPSAVAALQALAAMIVLAPGRLSMMRPYGLRCSNAWPMARTMTSIAPPGGSGMMTLIGPPAPFASAGAAHAPSSSASRPASMRIMVAFLRCFVGFGPSGRRRDGLAVRDAIRDRERLHPRVDQRLERIARVI